MPDLNFFKAQVLIAATFALALGLRTAPASAHDCARHADQNHKHCTGDGGGGGGGKPVDLVYTVKFIQGEISLNDPVYLPLNTCVAQTRDGLLTAWFERHALCATVETRADDNTIDDNTIVETLTDDISVQVRTNKQGQIVEVQLYGQDIIGKDGIAHESEEIVIDPPVDPLPEGGFTLHVDANLVPVWKMNKHLNGGGKRVEIVGYVSFADMEYTLIQP